MEKLVDKPLENENIKKDILGIVNRYREVDENKILLIRISLGDKDNKLE